MCFQKFLNKNKYFFTEIFCVIWTFFLDIEFKIRSLISKKNLFYYGYFGWADGFCFFLNQFNKIKYSHNNYALVWNNYNYKICKFFFSEKKIIKMFFFTPSFIPNYKIDNFLKKKKNFKPKIIQEKIQNKDFLSSNKDSIKNFLDLKLIDSHYDHLKNFKKKKYICFYFRYFSKGTKIIRSSNDINKCFLLIKFFIKNNLVVVLMGTKNEKYLSAVKKEFRDEIKDKKIFLSFNLLKNNDFGSQLYLMKYSQFYCGTQSGFLSMFYFFKKKAISFDGFFRDEYKNESFENIKFLYKQVYFEKKLKPLNLNETELINDINNLKENSTKEIINLVKTFL